LIDFNDRFERFLVPCDHPRPGLFSEHVKTRAKRIGCKADLEAQVEIDFSQHSSSIDNFSTIITEFSSIFRNLKTVYQQGARAPLLNLTTAFPLSHKILSGIKMG
jgi:hypothetical protein